MKLKKLLVIICLCVFVFGTMSLTAGKDYLKNHWQSGAGYYMEAAEMMPEKDFGFKPTKEIFSFAEQLLHVAATNYFFATMATGKKSPKSKEDLKAEGKSKKEVIALLKESFDYGEKALESLSEDKLKSKIDFAKKKISIATLFLFCCEHSIHHRGQLIVYLRLKGIKPPKYRTGFLK